MKVALKIVSVVIVLVIGLVTAIIANKGDAVVATEPSPSPSATVSVSPSPSPSPSEIVPPSPSPSVYTGPVNPLTGLPADAELAEARPYAIMINNSSAAQPQLGISKADIIFEIVVEGGITRMMALFQDVTDAGVIGSVRSARPYFVRIANGYDTIYIHAGGSTVEGGAYTVMADLNIAHLDGVNGTKQDIFYRDSDRRATLGFEHSLVTSSSLISTYVPTYGIRMTHQDGFDNGLTFSDNASIDGGTTAEAVKVHMSSSKSTLFEYDADASVYNLTQHGSAYVDGDNNQRISATNVLILRTEVHAIASDTAGRMSVDVTGSGAGTLCLGGQSVAISWSRADNYSPFAFKTADGSPLELAPGKSYICIISDEATVEIS